MVIVDDRSQHFEQLKLFKSYWQNCLRRLGGSSRFQVWLRKNWERCFGTTDSNFHEQRKQPLEQQLCYLIMRVFWNKTRILRGFVSLCSNLGQTRLDLRMNWSFNSWVFLQASNIFVWYTANGFVCWLYSWEFLFMNILFITFARDCCCWYVTGCTQ